ncbi:MAG: site-specific integrase [Pseudomonadota bacterium]
MAQNSKGSNAQKASKGGTVGKSNPRVKTRFEGVYYRESKERRFRGRVDVCYIADYYSPTTGKRVRQSIGWRSEGMTAELAAAIRRDLIAGKRIASYKATSDTVDAVGQNMAHSPATINNMAHSPTEGHTDSTPPSMLVSDAWALYLRDHLQAQGKTTKADITLYSKHIATISTLYIHDINLHTIANLIGELNRKGLSTQSVHHVIALLRRIIRKMIAWRKCTPINFDFTEIELPPINNKRTRYLTPHEARELLDALLQRSPRMHDMALISMHCGLRFGEIAALCFGDVDYSTQTIYIRESKSGRARQAVMTEAVMAMLQTIPVGSRAALIFPSRTGGIMRAPSDAFERTVKDLGLNNTGKVDRLGKPIEIADRKQRVVFHTLRHTYASWLAMSGQEQIMIADLLGHSKADMSARYIHLADNARRATAAAISNVFTQPHDD